jgi:hypothetical protein
MPKLYRWGRVRLPPGAKGGSWSLAPRGKGRKLVPERLISVHRVALEPPGSI